MLTEWWVRYSTAAVAVATLLTARTTPRSVANRVCRSRTLSSGTAVSPPTPRRSYWCPSGWWGSTCAARSSTLISVGSGSAALFACFLLPLVLCEVRLLQRVLVRDRMPGSQQFLVSLAGRRAELGPEIRSALPLRHSERFILEAMDGFRVAEGAAYGPPFGATPEMPLLMRKAAAARGVQPDPDDELLAESRVYSVYGNSYLDLEAGRLGLNLPEGRRHMFRSLIRRHNHVSRDAAQIQLAGTEHREIFHALERIGLGFPQIWQIAGGKSFQHGPWLCTAGSISPLFRCMAVSGLI